MKKIIFSVLFFMCLYSNAVPVLSNPYPNDPIFNSCVERANSFMNRQTLDNGIWVDLYTDVFWSSAEVSGDYIIHKIVGVYDERFGNGNPFDTLGGSCGHDLRLDVIKTNQNQPFKNNSCREQTASGSYIDYDEKILTEQIPISGTDLQLNYSTNYDIYSKSNKIIEQEFSRLFQAQTQSRVRVFSGEYSGSEVYSNEFNQINGATGFKYLWQPNLSVNSIVYKSMFQIIYEYSFNYLGLSGTYTDPQTGQIRNLYLPEISWVSLHNSTINAVIYNPRVWGLSGWTISDHHYFDRQSSKLFFGNGFEIDYVSFRTVTDPVYGQIDILVDKNSDSIIYKFDQQGRHLETYNNDLKYIVYRFEYENNKLKKIYDRFNKHTDFVYNSSGQIEKIISPFGVETNILVQNDQIVEVTNPLQKKYEMTYTVNKILNSFKNIDGVVTNFIYNEYDQITGEQKSNNKNQNFVSNFVGDFKENVYSKFFGMVKKFSTAFSQSDYSTTEYDSENRFIKIQRDSNIYPQSKTIYNQTVIDSQSPLNTAWIDYKPYTYFNTTTTESGQNVNQTTYVDEGRVYSDSNNPLTSTSKFNSTSTSNRQSLIQINNLNKTVTFQTPDYSYSYLDFNDLGLITKLRPANQYPIDITYNLNGQIVRKQKGTEWTSYDYDQFGYLSAESNSNNQTTTYLNNMEGQIIEKTLPNGDKVKFEYTDAGTPSKITTPNNQIHYFQMSLGDYITNAITPNNKNTSFEYDVDKRLTKISKPSGAEIVYNYKAQSANLQSITTPSGTLTINDIDSRGRLHSITSADQIKTETDWTHTQIQEQRFFDTDGSLIGKVTNNFQSNELKIRQIKINDQTLVDYNYDSAGRVASINNQAIYQYNNYNYTQSQTISFDGITATYATEDSDSGNKPIQIVSAQIKENPNLQLFMVMKRSFDTFGNATEFSQSTRNSQTGVYNTFYTLTPTYDANSRLIQIAKNRQSYINSQQVNSTDFLNEYMYPQNSNNNVKEYNQRTTPSSSPIKRTIANHTNDDALTKLSGSINRDYVYNDDGDLTSMTNCFGTTNYEYDVFGNLKKVTLTDGKIIEYKVDGLNRRIKKLVNGTATEYYLWYDQTHIAAILDGNKIIKIKYIYGPESQISPSYVVKDGVTYKVLHDPGLGSIRYVIDPSTQQVMQEVEYDENGNIMKNTNPDFQPVLFSGGLYDFDTKLTRFGARDYDATVGRWTTKDPIGFAGGDTNLYAYVGGNPMSYVDPSGLLAFELGGTLGGFFGGGFGLGGSTSGSGAITFNNSNPSNIELGTTLSGQARPIGVGISGGAGGYLSFTPFANNINDLAGGFGGVGFDIGFLSGSITFSSAGPTFSLGAGLGIPSLAAYTIGGYQSSQLRKQYPLQCSGK
jgi:RHS repeat-associated protein